MKVFNVVWKITKSIAIEAETKEEAITILETEHSISMDGDLVDHSLEIIEVEELNLPHDVE